MSHHHRRKVYSPKGNVIRHEFGRLTIAVADDGGIVVIVDGKLVADLMPDEALSIATDINHAHHS